MKIENWKLKFGNFQLNFKQKLMLIWMKVRDTGGLKVKNTKIN